ncbi:CU044_5270 family protein [Streptosporangium sp. 'caverna']|uniref:CU044_5270 family protein n=1 Tax=Streptosporangium sp. 'caverna' TaxID=2202249 RepID=UPI000D7EA868|nr:CU044_5270 family protein [Streptosporangium sp. 'caverna']AWS42858.1 hypothetical protein DKM19_17300 [Streptosporangium sp. 'caverna']
MDDLTALRELRADAPEPGAERLAAARARLVAGTDRAANRRGFLSLGRPMVLAGAFGLVAALVLTLFQIDRTGDPSPPTAARYASASEVFAQAALVAEARSTDASPRPDQWQYSKSLSRQPNEDSGDADTMEEWIRYDGKQTAGYDDDGRLRISDVPPDPGDDDLSPQQYAEKLRELPTDPDKLLAHVRGDRHWIDLPVEEGVAPAREDPDARAFRVISVYLEQQAIMPPKLEAAMYRALGKIPGVGVEVDVEDAAGRKGLGVFRETDGLDTRRYLILEPKTFRYLGMRMLWLRDEMLGSDLIFRAGSVYSTAELASGIVEKAGQRR